MAPPLSDEEAMTSLPPLRDVIAEHGLGARRSLGQHFLLDLNLTRRIARSPGDLTNELVIEIGPGPGGLTRGDQRPNRQDHQCGRWRATNSALTFGSPDRRHHSFYRRTPLQQPTVSPRGQ